MSKKACITNLKFYSNGIGKKKYRLLKKALPYLITTSLFLFGMNRAGYYFDDGKLMNHSTVETSSSISEDSILYFGKWEKGEDGYYREKDYYRVDSMSDDSVLECIKKIDTVKLASYLVNHEVIYQEDISFLTKLFNNTDISYFKDSYGQTDIYSVENFSDHIDLFLFYLLVQFGVTVFKGDVSEAFQYIFSKKRYDDDNTKVIKISDYKKKRIKK